MKNFHRFLLVFASIAATACSGSTDSSGTKDATIGLKDGYPPEAVTDDYPLRIVRIEILSTAPSRTDYFVVKNFGTTTSPNLNSWRITLSSRKGGSIAVYQDLSGVTTLAAGKAFGFSVKGGVVGLDGDTLRLVAPDGKIVQTISWTDKKPLGAKILPYAYTSTPIRIFYVIPNPKGNDSAGNEGFFLENITGDTVKSLSGWTVRSDGGQVKPLASALGLPTNFVPYGRTYSLISFSGVAWLNNTGDTLRLFNGEGKELQKVGWGVVGEDESVYAY